MSQQRKPLLTIAGVAIGLLANTMHTMAAETTYYDQKPWGVYLHTPESPEEGNPYCAIRTTLWENRSVGVEYILEAGDEIGIALRLSKEGWNLPVGETTTVKVQSMVGALGTPTMKAISGDELYFKATQFEPESMALGIALKLVLNPSNPQPLTVAFDGSEPVWSVPALGPYQTYDLNQVFSKCILDLRGLSVASSAGAAGEVTSPFTKKTAPTENTTSAPTPATPASSEWLFSTEDEGEGGQKICYAGTKAGNIKVGFMGSPGEDLIGYVDGLVDGNTIATWRVDGGMPDSLIGAPSDYSGWTEFTVSKELVEEAAHGSELAITASGKQVVVSLKGAADAIPAFNACLGKAPAKSASSSSAAPTEATKKTFRSCLLQVDGKKIIDGACTWGPYGDIGSEFVMEADGYFALLLAENETTATGYWNGERNAGHAHADLGKLRKSGNCWAGPKARLCVQQ